MPEKEPQKHVLTPQEEERYKKSADSSNVLTPVPHKEEHPSVLKGKTVKEVPDTKRISKKKFAPPTTLHGAFYEIAPDSAEAEILKVLKEYYAFKSTPRSLEKLNKKIEEIGEEFGRAEVIRLFNQTETTIAKIRVQQNLSKNDIVAQLKEMNTMLMKKRKQKRKHNR